MKNRARSLSGPWLVGAALLALGGRSAAAAEAPPRPAPEKAKKKPKKPANEDGWSYRLLVAANLSLSQSQGVVGLTDGVATGLGLQLEGRATYRRGRHAWINDLEILHTQSKIATIKRFSKSADRFMIQTMYEYRFLRRPRWGVFAQLRLTSELFPGSLIRDEAKDLQIFRDGLVVARASIAAQEQFPLTDALLPLVLKQLVGAVVKPYTHPALRTTLRLGVGAVQVFTGRGRVMRDDRDTPDVVELRELKDYDQSGVEVQASVRGTAVRKIISYGLSLEVMYPFSTSVPVTVPRPAQWNVELRANVTIKVYEWLAISYQLSVVRLPVLLPEWQVAGNLMLSFTANVGGQP